ncbi:MAG: YeeE/YedE family protein [Rhodospirillales bacterium]|nr:YeeE/YedE family protein [Rhodospirillales bacterium]
MEDMPISTIVASAGFIAGLIFGATAQKTNFCTMGALSDIVFMEDFNRFRAWLLAMAMAIIGTQTLHSLELVDTYKSIYLTSNLGWLGAIIGGALFGFGMTMAGGCANKNLVRIGGGNLKSIIVIIVMGIFAYMTLRGLLGLLRLEIEEFSNVDLKESGLDSQGMVDMAAALVGSEVDSVRAVVVAVFAGLLLIYCFKDAEFRSSPANLLGGLIIGLLVPVGWWITGVLGFDDFEPVPLASFTFVAPAGESVQYLMTFTGATINFGIAAVGGIIAGSFLMSVSTKSFHIEAFNDTDDMIRHLFGASIMGFGGVLSLGCTVGQGITGLSTLALGSLIAVLSIMAGGVLGLKYLEEGSFGGALRAVLSRQ